MFKRIKIPFLTLSDTCPRGRSKGKICSNEVSAKNNLPFLYTWKLERLFSFTSSSGKLWDYSNVFPARGYIWKLALNLGNVEIGEDKSYLSLFLALLDVASPLPLHIEVVLELSILDENYSQCSKRKVIHRFPQSKSEECHPYLISLETLKCPSSGFLVAEIIDVVIHSEEKVFLSPKPPNDCSLAHTWKIDGFSKLTEQYYKSAFLYNDHIWCLQLYPRGRSEEEDKSISLYLQLVNAAIPAPSGKIHAEYYFDWVDQIKGRNHHDRTHQIFDCKQPTWGWKKFLSLDALHEPSKGFLVNDTCIIKVGFLQWDNISK